MYWKPVTDAVERGANRGALESIEGHLLCASADGAEAIKALLEAGTPYPFDKFQHGEEEADELLRGKWEVLPDTELPTRLDTLWESLTERTWGNPETDPVFVTHLKDENRLLCSTEDGTRAVKALLEAVTGKPYSILFRSAMHKWELYVCE